MQIQNLPADAITRSSFIAEPNNCWISVDFSAMESRLGADIYQEHSMIKEFKEGSGDMHSLCAYMVYKDAIPRDTPIADIKELYPKLRKEVKGVEFSQQFGGGWKAVADSLNCSKEDAQKFVQAYADGFPGVTKFKEKGAKFVKTHGYVLICKHTGMKIWWEDFAKWREFETMPEYMQKIEYTSDERKEHAMAGAKWERMALNSPTQGTGAEIIKLASIILFNWIIEHNYFNIIKIANIVHDEINVEAPKEISNTVSQIVVKSMEKAANMLCKSLPIPAEATIGDHWIH